MLAPPVDPSNFDQSGGFSPASVLRWKQQRRQSSVRFRNYPKLPPSGCDITAQQAEAILEAEFILGYVIRAELTPVASCMPRKKVKGRLMGSFERLASSRSSNDLTQWK